MSTIQLFSIYNFYLISMFIIWLSALSFIISIQIYDILLLRFCLIPMPGMLAFYYYQVLLFFISHYTISVIILSLSDFIDFLSHQYDWNLTVSILILKMVSNHLYGSEADYLSLFYISDRSITPLSPVELTIIWSFNLLFINNAITTKNIYQTPHFPYFNNINTYS